MMHRFSQMNHSSFTAQRSESAYACASFFMLIIAGIAAAVSVLFVSASLLTLRLCILLEIAIILSVIVHIIVSLSKAPKEHTR